MVLPSGVGEPETREAAEARATTVEAKNFMMKDRECVVVGDDEDEKNVVECDDPNSMVWVFGCLLYLQLL